MSTGQPPAEHAAQDVGDTAAPMAAAVQPLSADWSASTLAATRQSVFPRWPLVVLVALFIIVPVVIFSVWPGTYTPALQCFLSIFLAACSYFLGHRRDIRRAAQQANDRWLPQAESVIFRLITLQANVRKLESVTRSGCASATCDLPELKEDSLRAVQVKMKSDCEASSQRLEDIADQLDDAIEDWSRFVAANCLGDECARIFDAIMHRRMRLAATLRRDAGVDASPGAAR